MPIKTATENTSESDNIDYTAHGCEISVRGNQITVRDGFEEITGTTDNEEWEIKTCIMGQIHCILLEYTPAQLVETVKKSHKNAGN